MCSTVLFSGAPLSSFLMPTSYPINVAYYRFELAAKEIARIRSIFVLNTNGRYEEARWWEERMVSNERLMCVSLYSYSLIVDSEHRLAGLI